MAIRIGDTAPDFEVTTTAGDISFHSWIGDSWCVFFSHPKDYTPVCTTELGAVAKRQADFEKRSCKVIALSVDSLDDHNGWSKDITETQGAEVTYPIICDTDRSVAEKFGMLDQTNKDAAGLPLTVRSVFIIAPDKSIKLILTYPASCGRNFDEIIRVLDSLQLSSKHKVTTPANWNQGEDVIVAPSVSDAEAKEIFGEFKTVKPYLRYTKQPN